MSICLNVAIEYPPNIFLYSILFILYYIQENEY